jgi:hypothetical protein
MLQTGRFQVHFPMSLEIFNLPNHSNRIVVLVSTQPLTETSKRIFLGSEVRPERKAAN